RSCVVERQSHVWMPLEGICHGRVGLFEYIREDPAEVADGLVVVESERQRDARRHAPQPASVTSGSSGGAATSMPAAGRERRSGCSWSIRVVEKSHSDDAMAWRITSTHLRGTPSLSRS